jgi:hypothetical protein
MDAEIVGDKAYLAAGSAGVQIVSLAGADRGSILGRLDTPGSASAIFVQDFRAYVADTSGLLILDVEHSEQPVLLGSYPTPREIKSLAVEGNRAFLAIPNEAIYSVDVSNPLSPSLLAMSDSFVPYDGKLLVSNGIVHFVWKVESRYNPKLSVFDARDPAATTFIGSGYLTGVITDAALVGDFLYATSWDHGLSIVDVSDPASPQTVQSCPVPYGALGLGVSHGHMYFAGSGGLFSGPLHRDCRDVFVDAVSDTIAPGGAGTLLGPIAGKDERARFSLTPYPNPSRGETSFSYRIPSADRCSLVIFDASGRIVRTLLNGDATSAADGFVRWDGRDEAGKRAASGVYFVRVEGAGAELQRKLVLMR